MANKKTALTLALGTAFAASLAVSPVVNAAGNPFAMQSLDNGYMVADAGAKAKDGKCGGAAAADMKAKEGKCGDAKAAADKAAATKAKDGKCGGEAAAAMKAKEGKCGDNKEAATKTK